MVIGNGLLAKSFSSYREKDDVVIFASGVSDSKLTDDTAYNRELKLLIETLKSFPDKLFIYFSTCSILDSSLAQTPYITHKQHIENYIKQHASRFLVFRLSNLAGRGGNPKTILNYLVHVISHNIHFELWENSYRNVLDIDDAFTLMNYFIGSGRNNETINIANTQSYSAKEMVATIEDYLGKKADFSLVKKGDKFEIDTTEVKHLAGGLGINFAGDYLSTILRKYYHNNDLPASKN